jgi:hypothetical protein
MGKDAISFENTKRMCRRKQQVKAEIEGAAEADLRMGLSGTFDELDRQRRSQLNRMVYEFAEKAGFSVYDVCFGYMPQYNYPEIEHAKEDGVMVMSMDVSLVPMPLELEKGPGYWKSKYYRLKERLQELIDTKDD